MRELNRKVVLLWVAISAVSCLAKSEHFVVAHPWRVFYSPKPLEVAAQGVKSYDQQLTLPSGETLKAMDLSFGNDGRCCLDGLLGIKQREDHWELDEKDNHYALLVNELEVSADVTVTVGVAAEWLVSFYLQGHRVYTTWPDGVPGGVDYTQNLFPLQLKKGRNLVEIYTRRGLCPWKLSFGDAPKVCYARENAGVSLRERIDQTCKVKRESIWYGHHRIHFDFRGHSAWIVEPSVEPLQGMPWTWTMQWAEAFVPRTGVVDLLKAGYHHATIDLFGTRMSDEGVEIAAAFQQFLVGQLGFAAKTRLIGPSWGGFFSMRYAGLHPENVARIYLDSPLLTFDGYRKAEGREAMLSRIGPWATLEPKDRKWTPMPQMPINYTETIAKAGIPVFLVYGGQDQTVNPTLNSQPFIDRIKKAGGKLTVDARPFCGHHPHGFDYENRRTILDFLMAK